MNAKHTRTASCIMAGTMLSLWFSQQPVFAGDGDYLTTKTPLRLLSANDGEVVWQFDPQNVTPTTKPIADSITVIDLGPDGPPNIRTVYGTVPNTLMGPPYMAMSPDGRLGFVTNHGWRPESPIDESTDFASLPPDRHNLLSVIDLSSPTLEVVPPILLPSLAYMTAMHPDGKHLIVSAGKQLLVYAIEGSSVRLARTNDGPAFIYGFAVSPKGDRIVAVSVSGYTKDTAIDDFEGQIQVFSLDGDRIEYLHQVTIDPELGKIDQPIAPRFSPDGQRVLALNGLGFTGKGRLDDVLSVDMTLPKPAVTEVVRQLSDGLESLAFHPNGHMAVVTCLNTNANPAYSRLAVIDLTSKPMRQLSQTPIESVPEGIEFSPEGEKLFVGCTHANQIVVFDVVGFRLERSPFVLPTGHGHSAMAIAPRSTK